ncbi:hypothetical protein ACJX0J_013316, partial [Zea mays]
EEIKLSDYKLDLLYQWAYRSQSKEIQELSRHNGHHDSSSSDDEPKESGNIKLETTLILGVWKDSSLALLPKLMFFYPLLFILVTLQQYILDAISSIVYLLFYKTPSFYNLLSIILIFEKLEAMRMEYLMKYASLK